MKQLFSIMSNSQTHYHFKLDFQTVNQHTGDQLLIHSTKHRMENQLKVWIYPVYSPTLKLSTWLVIKIKNINSKAVTSYIRVELL